MRLAQGRMDILTSSASVRCRLEEVWKCFNKGGLANVDRRKSLTPHDENDSIPLQIWGSPPPKSEGIDKPRNSICPRFRLIKLGVQ